MCFWILKSGYRSWARVAGDGVWRWWLWLKASRWSFSLFLPSLPGPRSAHRHERRQSPEAKKSQNKYSRAMQTNCSQLHSPSGAAGSEDASASQCVQTRLTGEASCLYSGDVHIQISSLPKECAENPSSRNTRSGVHSCTHGCVHSRLRSHSHSEARQPDDSDTEYGDQGSSSFSEFRYLFKWLQKSLLYILILGVKLVMQHITGISLGIGLLTTFIYANKSIVNQVFLRERCSKIQCAWLLVFLAGSSVLLYYTFHSQSLYYR